MKDEKEKRPWFRFVDLADDEAEISLFDEIGGWGQSVEDFKAEFDKIKGRKSIHLNINSPGGVVTDGWAIYNILSRVKDRLTVEVVGADELVRQVEQHPCRPVPARTSQAPPLGPARAVQ